MKIVWLVLTLSFLGVESRATDYEDSRMVVHLLDYLAKDYGGAVRDGKIISEGEYKEQLDFANQIVETTNKLPAVSVKRDLVNNFGNLKRLIETKSSAAEVSRQARSLQREMMSLANLETSPDRWPNLRSAQVLFQENCASCHGKQGFGDGAAGAALEPKPANFQDVGAMEGLSPFQAFNTIRLGVPGTGMASFETFSDRETWDLAFFVVGLRHFKNASDIHDEPMNADDKALLKTVASNSDSALRSQALDVRSLRTRSELKDENEEENHIALALMSLKKVGPTYGTGDFDGAKKLTVTMYLEHVEPLEPIIRVTQPQLVDSIENSISLLRSEIESQKPLEVVEKAIVPVQNSLEAVGKMIRESNKMSPHLAFIMACTIPLREGFEAALIIILLLSSVRGAGNVRAVKWIHGGWMAAVFVGVVVWFLSGMAIKASGAQGELIEGVSSLLAVAVLIYVGFWLHTRSAAEQRQSNIKSQLKTNLTQSSIVGLFVLSFLGVFREALETVLLLRVTLVQSQNQTTIFAAGFFVAVVAVLALSWFMVRLSGRLPVSKIFSISSWMLLALAVILAGQGIHALQETGLLSIRLSPIPFRADFLGIYPTLETVFAQLTVLALMAGLMWWSRKGARLEV